MKNNRGLSLIELIVSMAIVAIVSVSLLSFIGVSTNQYKKTNAEVNLQYEAQLADNQIHDMLIDVTAGLSYYVGSADGTLATVDGDLNADEEVAVAAMSAQDDAGTAGGVKKLCLLDWDTTTGETKNIVSVITWKEETKELTYSSYEYSEEAGITGTDQEEVLLAEYVTGFFADLTKIKEKNQVSYVINFENKGRTYTAKNTVTLRNNVLVNSADTNKVYEDIAEISSTVDSVLVSIDNIVLTRGASQTFAATVQGENFPSQDVIWSLSEESYDDKDLVSGTRINPSTGVLTMGLAEKSQQIRVIATSVQSQKKNPENPVRGSAIVMTRFVSGISFVRTSTNDGPEQDATITMTGANLEKEMFSSGFSFEGATVSTGSCEIKSNKTECFFGNVQVSYTQAYTANTDVKVTASYTGLDEHPFIEFKTGNPWTKIVSARIKRTDADSYGVDRGASATYKVQVQRDGEWKDAGSDENINVKWQINNNKSEQGKDLITKTESGKTCTITVSKNPEILAYSTTRTCQVQATITDHGESTGNVGDKTYNVNVPAVTIGFTSESIDSTTYYEFNTTARFSGIYLEKSDIALAEDSGNRNDMINSTSFVIDNASGQIQIQGILRDNNTNTTNLNLNLQYASVNKLSSECQIQRRAGNVWYWDAYLIWGRYKNLGIYVPAVSSPNSITGNTWIDYHTAQIGGYAITYQYHKQNKNSDTSVRIKIGNATYTYKSVRGYGEGWFED